MVEGRVWLASGAPAAGVQVRLFDLRNLRSWVDVTTDAAGYFALPLRSLPGAAAQTEPFNLGANYPNPFNPSTVIPYQLPTAMPVRLEVFNVLGQRIATLVDGQRSGGFHTAHWDGANEVGQAVGAGVYIYRLSGDGLAESRRMVLLDGQVGTRAVPSGGLPVAGTEGTEATEVYGLTVSGAGLVPFVNPAFRVATSRGPVDLVVEAVDGISRAKTALSGGVLGDVDNNGRVDFSDALLVVLYSGDKSTVMPNNGDISLGDVNADGQVDFTDAYLITVYLNDSSDPTLPEGIGTPVQSDRAILVALYEATDGANWRSNTNWLSDKPLSEWYGVDTDDNGRVIQLLLSSNELSGTIPSSLGSLTHLRTLDLSSNELSGTVPSSLGSLTHLQELFLFGNELSGSIPSSLGSLTHLQLLGLHRNELSGTIPSSLGDLTHLQLLALEGNPLLGALPSELTWSWQSRILVPVRHAVVCADGRRLPDVAARHLEQERRCQLRRVRSRYFGCVV